MLHTQTIAYLDQNSLGCPNFSSLTHTWDKSLDYFMMLITIIKQCNNKKCIKKQSLSTL